jgi:hypothetical protein
MIEVARGCCFAAAEFMIHVEGDFSEELSG